MQILRTVLLAGTALVIGAGVIHSGTASAQAVSDGSANVVCVQGAGSWTDCTLTLNRGIAAGGSIAGSLPSQDGTVLYCDRAGEPHGDGTAEVPVCGINGNAAVFDCSAGCGAGTQFVMSALGGSGASVSQDLRISSSGSAAFAPPAGNLPALLGILNGA